VEILLDNALKYATSNTEISVNLQKHEFYCILSVSNYGEEIASKDLTNIFERFYRMYQSRTSKNNYGLGLSIAKSIISDHNGEIWCESSKGKNTFYTQLRISNCIG
jgi:signal transduction histidine kinase